MIRLARQGSRLWVVPGRARGTQVSSGRTHHHMDRTEDYRFELPPDLIAQEPLSKRCDARLMVVIRDKKTIHHSHDPRFGDLVTRRRHPRGQ